MPQLGFHTHPSPKSPKKESFIDIYLRMRPNNNLFNYGENWIEIPSHMSQSIAGKKYTFSKVFEYQVSQQDLFNHIGLPLVRSCVSEGKNALIFSYGITNAGKTFTILGTEQQPGLLPRILEYLLKDEFIINHPKQSPDIECFEIYNEEIHDILAEESHNPKNFIRANILDLGISQLMKIIQNKRIQSDTGLNSNSSRSHLLVKIYFKDIIICLVDLAGSERFKRIIGGGTIQSINETCSINKSLLVLGRCIRGLIDQNETHNTLLPFRDSKLTKYLSEFFTPRNYVRIIANISTREEDLDETNRVLEYTSLAARIKPIPITNVPIKEQQKERMRKLKDLVVGLNEKLLFTELSHKVSLFSQEWRDFIFNSRNELNELNQNTFFLCTMFFEKDFDDIEKMSKSVNTSPIVVSKMVDKSTNFSSSKDNEEIRINQKKRSIAKPVDEQENQGDTKNKGVSSVSPFKKEIQPSKKITPGRTPIKFRLRGNKAPKHNCCSPNTCTPR